MRNSFINKRFANDGVYNVTFYIIAANIIVYLLYVFNVSIKGVPIVNYLALTPLYVVNSAICPSNNISDGVIVSNITTFSFL